MNQINQIFWIFIKKSDFFQPWYQGRVPWLADIKVACSVPRHGAELDEGWGLAEFHLTSASPHPSVEGTCEGNGKRP